MDIKQTVFEYIVGENLFTVDKSFLLGHCISRDCALGAGIAAAFNAKFNMRQALRNNNFLCSNEKVMIICTDDGYAVANMVTKPVYWSKPTYESLYAALVELRDKMMKEGFKNLALPKIGCGLDKLEWIYVKEIIRDVFFFSGFYIKIYI